MKLSACQPFYFLLVFILFFSRNVFADPPFSGSKFPPPFVPGSRNQDTKPEDKVNSLEPGKSQSPSQSSDTQALDKSAAKDLFTKATYEDFEPQEDFELFDESNLGPSAVTPPTINKTPIDPGTITLIQSTFLGNFNLAFAKVSSYALKLLYLFAVLEIVVLGFIWALQRDVGWSNLFFKIIKIGLIFFIINNYTWLLDIVMRSFAQLAGVVINNTAISKYVFNPAKIWQYGYNSGVHLLQLATNSNSFGLAMVQLSLGMGILLVFGLLGIQMILQIVGFYSVSLGALILLPFGAFTLGRNMFDRAVQAVFQAGIRLMVLITIIGVAVVVWDGFQLADLATTTKFNINQPLGLFFTALLFSSLAFYLPKVLSQAVGSFSSDAFGREFVPSYGAQAPAAAPIVTMGGIGDVQAATVIEATGAATGGGSVSAGEVSVAAAQPVSTFAAPTAGSIEARVSKETLAQASSLSKSISESTARRVKEAVLKAMKKEK